LLIKAFKQDCEQRARLKWVVCKKKLLSNSTPIKHNAILVPNRIECDQLRLACSEGVSLSGAEARDPVAWMAGRREIE
jgi:hypothetical protein